MADAAELITRILDPIAFRANEDALLTSAQNRRVQQAESRRADRDQQLQEILAPLQSRRLSQELQLNTLKLEEADQIAQTRIADAAANNRVAGLFHRAAASNFDNEVVSGIMEELKNESSLLTNPRSAFFRLDQKIAEEAFKARQKEDEIDKALKIAQIRTSGDTPLREDQLLTRARELDAQAEQARLSGNATEFQRLKDEANLFRSKAAPRESSIRVTQPGGATIEVNQGPRGASVTPTVQTDLQKRQLVMELGTEAANQLLTRIRPQDVGVAGWVGGNVFPFIRQIRPGTGDAEVIPNRMALGEFGELLKSGLSAEDVSRMSEGDVKRLHRIGTDLLEVKLSYEDIVGRINEARDIFTRRSRTYSERMGLPIEDHAKTPQEIQSTYETQKAAILQSFKENRLTRAQAEAEVKIAQQRAINSLQRFHNITPNIGGP